MRLLAHVMRSREPPRRHIAQGGAREWCERVCSVGPAAHKLPGVELRTAARCSVAGLGHTRGHFANAIMKVKYPPRPKLKDLLWRRPRRTPLRSSQHRPSAVVPGPPVPTKAVVAILLPSASATLRGSRAKVRSSSMYWCFTLHIFYLIQLTEERNVKSTALPPSAG